MNEYLDANATGIAFAFWIFAGLLLALLIARVVQYFAEDRYRIDRLEPRCERTGSQAEFTRRLNAR